MRRLLWQLYPSYLLITVLCLSGIGWFVSDSLQRFCRRQYSESLETQAHLLIPYFAPYFGGPEPSGNTALLQKACRDLGRRSGTRITLIRTDGKVLGDSEKDPSRMDNHGDRPEVLAALAGRVGLSVRYSYTQHLNRMYVALPLQKNGRIEAVLRTSAPLTAVDQALRGIRGRIAWGFLIGVLLAAGASFLVSRRLSRPLDDLTRGAERFARGDLEREVLVRETASREIVTLAKAMNRMAKELHLRMQEMGRRHRELNTVLASMTESVLVVDGSGRLFLLNRSAADLLDIDPEGARGRNVEEVARNAALLKLIREVLDRGQPVETEIVFHKAGDTFVQAHGTPLEDSDPADQSVHGAVVVMSDITRIRMVDRIRREFVANVSHELRTPITTIQGFVETLLEGAMEDPRHRERFLGIIASHTQRLNRIVDDLLTLSHIEQKAERTGIDFQTVSVAGVLRSARQVCAPCATKRNVSVKIEAEEGHRIRANAHLLEQALVNLLDNAIKYSKPGDTILLQAELSHNEAIIRVRDHGCGIPKEHLPRIFERFYRVDKARSRNLGGTGLGLAIVKHIVQAHGGRVEVESTPGAGSVFTIRLPQE